MKLSKDDVELFYKLYPALLSYTNRQLKITSRRLIPEEYMDFPLEERFKVRNALYDNIELIDSFVEENPFGFSPEELEIVSSWKNFLRGRFYLIRYLKKHAIFLDDESPHKAYGVVALRDFLENMLGDSLPIVLEAVLLPFKNQIAYDGLLRPYNIFIGSGIRRELDEEYREAKLRYGMITGLPFQVEEKKISGTEQLKFYLKTKASREMYWDEIWELIEKNPDLLTVYHQEMGKISARTYGRQLREIGLRDAWFAVLEGLIVASGKSKGQVEQILKDILLPGKRDFVYIFHLKK